MLGNGASTGSQELSFRQIARARYEHVWRIPQLVKSTPRTTL
jgi:hypothetical protein